jgi:putative ABC transport system ATP-binding protein
MFQLNGVTYKHILDIDTLQIAGGRITCIVGESGGGKTTLLRLLNKLISPDQGEITYNGTPLNQINSVELRRTVVMLSQSPAIFPGTVGENLNAGLTFAEKPSANVDRLHEALALVQLKKPLADNAEKLSGGEKQRLALARIMLLEPEVLLLDEPSSSLDEETEGIIIEHVIRYTREHGKTLIMVTHSKKVARDFADTIIEIKEGRVAGREEVRQ